MPDRLSYEPGDWYWIVGGDESRWWSSKAGAYEVPDSAEAAAFVEGGREPTAIANETELVDVLVGAGHADNAPPLPAAADRLAALARIDRQKARAAGFTADELSGKAAVAEDDARLAVAAAAIGMKSESDRAALERRIKNLEDAKSTGRSA